LKNADRFDELIEELKDTRWDLLLLNETWREEPEEQRESEQGHVFAGCGHSSGRKGVALVLHQKWKAHLLAFNPSDERLCSIDFIAHGTKIRALSAYFPDCSYNDAEVQKVYDKVAEQIQIAKKKRYSVVLGGDFNAKVGAGPDVAEHPSAGPHGFGVQNSRGQWLLTWASSRSLKIANTFYSKPDAKLITFEDAHGPRQLDYILLDNGLRSKLRDVESGNLLDLGSDHKCLTASFSFESCNHNQKTKGRRKPNIASPWPPRSLQQYTEQLQQELDGINPRETVEMRHCKIQEAMISASHQQGCDRHSNSVKEDRHELLEKLIAERKTLPGSNATQRGQLSKAIRKELRRIREEARCQKIHGLLSNFSQLKAIGGIKDRKKKHMTIQMEDSQGK